MKTVIIFVDKNTEEMVGDKTEQEAYVVRKPSRGFIEFSEGGYTTEEHIMYKGEWRVKDR